VGSSVVVLVGERSSRAWSSVSCSAGPAGHVATSSWSAGTARPADEHVSIAKNVARTVALVARPDYAETPESVKTAYAEADLILAPWPAGSVEHWPADLQKRTLHLGALGWTAGQAPTPGPARATGIVPMVVRVPHPQRERTRAPRTTRPGQRDTWMAVVAGPRARPSVQRTRGTTCCGLTSWSALPRPAISRRCGGAGTCCSRDPTRPADTLRALSGRPRREDRPGRVQLGGAGTSPMEVAPGPGAGARWGGLVGMGPAARPGRAAPGARRHPGGSVCPATPRKPQRSRSDLIEPSGASASGYVEHTQLVRAGSQRVRMET